MVVKEAAEMYLETILLLSREQSKVRAVDVARRMGYSRPTVSAQMKQFRQNGYVCAEEDGGLLLTEHGRAVAERMYERHRVISRLLIGLGVNEQTAFADACRMEHYISEETFQKLRQHVEQLNAARPE